LPGKLLVSILCLACLGAVACTPDNESDSQEKVVALSAPAASQGECFRLMNCQAAFNPPKLTSTEEHCWEDGGNSWLEAETGQCRNNPEPE
jgi:hypothetical protein